MVMSIEQHVEWIGECIEHLQASGLDSIEATAESEEQWSRHCSEVADTTLFPQGESWYTGANIQGKTMSFPIYLAGADVYRGICNRVAANGYEGFALAAAEHALVQEA
ncbi:Phenylacetone monooxygenase [compost metagenome]